MNFKSLYTTIYSLRSTFILLLVVSFTNCSSENYISTIKDKQQFIDLSGPPLTNKYFELMAVKVVYDLSNKKTYYLNHSRFKLHYDFCASLSPYPLDAYNFNLNNYSEGPNRNYLLGNINYRQASDEYFLELSPTDEMSLEHIQVLRNAIINSTYLGENLKFFLNNTRYLANKGLIESVPTVHPSEIYKGLQYQPIYESSRVGRLRWPSRSDLKTTDFEPTDILLLDHTPLVLPNVAGVIVTELQTPLSHLTILGQNRKIPICASSDTVYLSQLQVLSDSIVEFTVRKNSFSVVLTTKPISVKNRLPKLKLKADLTPTRLISLSEVKPKTRAAIGNKAANLALLQKLAVKRPFKTPENAFAIPFFFYHQHIVESGANQLIDSLLNGEFSSEQTNSLLKQIRKKIKKHPVNNNMKHQVHSRLNRDTLYDTWRFRSSTNAEDEIGFSGAGLYNSASGTITDPNKSIEKAIKKVWSSLWSEQAFLERNIYNIDQSTVFMGVLVHRSFPDEVLNGVAITKNLYRPENEGYVVNVQLGENSVVKPDPGEITDQFICYPKQSQYLGLYDSKVIDLITTSSLGNGRLLMTDDEIAVLANELYAIKRYFSTRIMLSTSNLNAGFDVEFKLYGPNRELYIKQVRIYND